MTYNVISAVCQNLSRPIVPRLLVLFLGVLTIWQIISGVISITSLNESDQNMTVAINTTPNQHASNAGLSTPFFGKYVPINFTDGDVKQSMLNLKVVGIMLASPEENSQVILHTAGGRDETFRIGDTLPGGAVIKRITVDGVFVERKGELESLSFPKNELIFEAPAKPLKEDEVHAF